VSLVSRSGKGGVRAAAVAVPTSSRLAPDLARLQACAAAREEAAEASRQWVLKDHQIKDQRGDYDREEPPAAGPAAPGSNPQSAWLTDRALTKDSRRTDRYGSGRFAIRIDGDIDL
jgi:hypothetical protein